MSARERFLDMLGDCIGHDFPRELWGKELDAAIAEAVEAEWARWAIVPRCKRAPHGPPDYDKFCDRCNPPTGGGEAKIHSATCASHQRQIAEGYWYSGACDCGAEP